uniref:Uncharacterized protein n=1 Tax=Amphimedon queenslandica TaxID=400682 RepID=A0A1X7UPM6_AMPQE
MKNHISLTQEKRIGKQILEEQQTFIMKHFQMRLRTTAYSRYTVPLPLELSTGNIKDSMKETRL